jgi:hypothetical protein
MGTKCEEAVCVFDGPDAKPVADLTLYVRSLSGRTSRYSGADGYSVSF